jgi:acyl-CoA synthetase (NDP forming)
VIITAGFAEIGTHGENQQHEIVDRARKGNMVLVGPNCSGIMRPASKLYSLMRPMFPPAGPVAIISQSGNVGSTLVMRLKAKGFGCSCFVSSGNEADLHCEDYFEFLLHDHDTSVILSYIEGFKNGRRFFDKARLVTKKKPIVILNAGRNPAGARAAQSHTGSLAVSDSKLNGICKQAGVLQARSLDELSNIGKAGVHSHEKD